MSSFSLIILGFNSLIIIAPILASYPIFPGRCPIEEVEVIKNFNQTKFQDFWYVIQRYEVAPYKSCSRYEYHWGDGQIRKFIQILEQIKRSPENPEIIITERTQEFLRERERFSNNGKYFNQCDMIHFQDSHFIDTDYENYAVLWTCLQRIGRHEQNLIVMARDKFFDINSSESLNATLAKLPFNRSLLNPVDHKDKLCDNGLP